MAIKRVRYAKKRKRRGSKFHQGVYQPLTENGVYKKYIPPQDTLMNSSEKGMTYRSSWEKVFAHWLDRNDSVKAWGSEPFSIRYVSPKDGQFHRYYIDFVFIDQDDNKFLIEIKPSKQRKDPINLAKWEAAERYCQEIDAKFIVVTEIELKRWKLIK